ncbi:hypothetical protein K438DRAFT_1750404 [Mycena galopus ATCC 62051]|nr:hypothetical protein K438DRAFT_1750404 [Mycena galopus ATCC 62051]
MAMEQRGMSRPKSRVTNVEVVCVADVGGKSRLRHIENCRIRDQGQEVRPLRDIQRRSREATSATEAVRGEWNKIDVVVRYDPSDNDRRHTQCSLNHSEMMPMGRSGRRGRRSNGMPLGLQLVAGVGAGDRGRGGGGASVTAWRFDKGHSETPPAREATNLEHAPVARAAPPGSKRGVLHPLRHYANGGNVNRT